MHESSSMAGGSQEPARCSRHHSRSRHVTLFAVVTMLVAVMAGCGRSSSSSTSSTPADATVQVKLTDFAIQPTTIEATAGRIAFVVTNVGQAPHDFEIRAAGKKIGGTKTLQPGQNETYTTTLKRGPYDAYCSQPGHESLGMHVPLTVR